MRARLGELVQVADVITPNLTEACMLLKIPTFTEGLSRSQAKSLLVRLSELGPNYVVITGAPMASGQIANIGYDRQHNSFWCILCDYVPVSYPGTGDLFASVLTGGFFDRGQPADGDGPRVLLCGALHQDHLQLLLRHPLRGHAGKGAGGADRPAECQDFSLL